MTTVNPTKLGPLPLYRARLAEGSIKPDQAQSLAVEKFQSLHHALAAYEPDAGAGGWLARFGLGGRLKRSFQWCQGDTADCPDPKQGLYIFGEVGRGKSMLMDLFFETAPVERKKRVHFHAFMRDVHEGLHAWRKNKQSNESDPLPRIAKTIADEVWLLCFDELQVLDIADAMIIGRLFGCLFDEGVVIVATSNRHPSDLYKDGLQRDRFLPFIALIQDKLDILELDSERDYRLGRKKGLRVFHSPLDREAAEAMDACFGRLTGYSKPKSEVLIVHERSLPIPCTADGVARFSFDDLCGQALGASDYLAIATHFHTLLLDDVPRLGPANRDKAKRFVTLVDALYEHKVTLVCSAEAPPEYLYPEGTGAFEFQRTVSRLMEMQAEDYLGRPHLT